MAISVKPLHPLFGAEIGQVEIGPPLDDSIVAEIRAAFEEYSLLLFRDQELDDDKQIAFSERFGPLETTVKANPAGGTYFARQSNLDIDTGAVIPPDDRRIIYQKANMFWHTDSSFKRVPALCSLLSARLVPPEGGDTEFATMRAAYAELPEATKRRVERLVAEHSLVHSRSLVDPRVLTEDQKAEFPPVPQTLAPIRSTAANQSMSAPMPRTSSARRSSRGGHCCAS